MIIIRQAQDSLINANALLAVLRRRQEGRQLKTLAPVGNHRPTLFKARLRGWLRRRSEVRP